MYSNNPCWGQTSQNQRVGATYNYNGTSRVPFYEEVPYGRRTSEYQGVDSTREQGRSVAYAFNDGMFIPNQPSRIGPPAQLNFPQIPNHTNQMGAVPQMAGQDVAIYNRSRNGFVRGKSRFHGVARHDQTGKWQAWNAMGDRVLGIFETEEEAAIAFDLACIKQKGHEAITNYDIRYYDVKSMKLNANKPKLQGMDQVETTRPQRQTYDPQRINTSINAAAAGYWNNIQPTIYRARGFRPAKEGLANFVEILGLKKQDDNGSWLRFQHGDFSPFNFYRGMQHQMIIRKPAARNRSTAFGFGHPTLSAFQSYSRPTETGDHQQYSQLAQNPWLSPAYSVNSEREQWLRTAGLGFEHSGTSHFKVYERSTMWKGKVKASL